MVHLLPDRTFDHRINGGMFYTDVGLAMLLFISLPLHLALLREREEKRQGFIVVSTRGVPYFSQVVSQ